MAKKNERQIDPAEEFVDPTTLLDTTMLNQGDPLVFPDVPPVIGVTGEALVTGGVMTPVVPVALPGLTMGVADPQPVKLSDVVLELSILASADDVNRAQWGYISTRIDLQLDGELALTFRRLLCAAKQEHATYVMRGVVTHVESPADVVRWLMHSVLKSDMAVRK